MILNKMISNKTLPLFTLLFVISCAIIHRKNDESSDALLKSKFDSLETELKSISKSYLTTVPNSPFFKTNCYTGWKEIIQNNISGIIFNEDTNCFDSFNLGSFYNLDSLDISKSNHILQSNLILYDSNKVTVFPKLSKSQIMYCLDTAYIRQYFGRIIGSDTLIYINSVHKSFLPHLPDWRTQHIGAYGGGYLFWQSIVSISNSKIEYFQINPPE